MLKKTLFWAAVVICLLIINNLSHSLYDLWQKRSVLTEAENQLVYQQKENKRLANQLSQAQNQGYIEEEARDKLFLIKPGEQEVIIPRNLLKPAVLATPSPQPNWQQWIELFTN